MTEARPTGRRTPRSRRSSRLVIRGMVRGAPDEATDNWSSRVFAITKGPITMPTPARHGRSRQAAARSARRRGRAGDRQALRRIPTDQPEAARRLLRLADAAGRNAQRPQRRRIRRQRPGPARRGSLLHRPDPSPDGRDLAPHLAGYRPRLQEALDKFDDGEFVAGSRPR